MEDINFFKHHPPLREEKEDIEMNFFNSFLIQILMKNVF